MHPGAGVNRVTLLRSVVQTKLGPARRFRLLSHAFYTGASATTGDRHGFPLRVLAPHWGARFIGNF
jgi:hypothetical protein